VLTASKADSSENEGGDPLWVVGEIQRRRKIKINK